MTTKETFGTETGCVFDSHLGIYIYQEIVDLARSWGWEFDGWEEWEKGNNEHFDVGELADYAMDWLNDNVAESGYCFVWWEGNVMYWSESDYQEFNDA